MKLMSRFSIAGRMYFFSSILIIALAGLAVASWFLLSGVSELAESTNQVRLVQLSRIASTEQCVLRIQLLIRQAMLVNSPEEVDKIATEIDSKRKLIAENDADFDKDTPSSGPVRDAFHGWLDLQNGSWPYLETGIKLIQEGRKDDAYKMLMTNAIPALERMQVLINGGKAQQRDYVKSDLSGIQAAASQIRIILTGMVLFIAAGLMAFSWTLGAALRLRIASSQTVANRVRDGDLVVGLVDSVRDEFTPLISALHAMQESLASVVGTVRANADNVASASSDIAQGNSDLSERTEGQASSLEETAASMAELTETVKQNADNAQQADALAKRATDMADASNDAVQGMVGTIEKISASSTRIAEITGVIESIAFQTNILALNAAVEAARAGEQGRGFAVVASEVRSLAQRSAIAAKEINELIASSVTLIQGGVKQAADVGATMEGVKQSIRQVSEIVGDIAGASGEQSRGIEQVNQAVAQMDEATQKNAALVEQAAAGARLLQEQAISLKDAVSVFKLADPPALSNGVRA